MSGEALRPTCSLTTGSDHCLLSPSRGGLLVGVEPPKVSLQAVRLGEHADVGRLEDAWMRHRG